ncbi:MAG TPA: hypothetical protein VMX76_02630 [Nevskiaceae bacterium]|nr:hypothetical protein [Nevskiaceae bacterium]
MKKITNYLNKLLLVGVVHAQEINIEPPAGWGNLANITVPNVVATIIKLILIVAAIIAFVFLVFGGIKWITSGGDKEGTQAAQKTLTAALIGLLIVFAAWAIMTLLNTFFNIDILGNLEVPSIPIGE